MTPWKLDVATRGRRRSPRGPSPERSPRDLTEASGSRGRPLSSRVEGPPPAISGDPNRGHRACDGRPLPRLAVARVCRRGSSYVRVGLDSAAAAREKPQTPGERPPCSGSTACVPPRARGITEDNLARLSLGAERSWGRLSAVARLQPPNAHQGACPDREHGSPALRSLLASKVRGHATVPRNNAVPRP